MTERLIQAGIVTVGTVKAGLIAWLILTLRGRGLLLISSRR